MTFTATSSHFLGPKVTALLFTAPAAPYVLLLLYSNACHS